MQKSTMRIEDACIWRRALAEHPDETMTILLEGLRLLAKSRNRKDSLMARETLIDAGFDAWIKESK